MKWLLALVVLVAAAVAAEADPGRLVYSTEGNNLRRYDVDSIGSPPLVEDFLVERASAAEAGGGIIPTGLFRDMNGMICQLRDGTGRTLNGEDTGQPSPPAGFGIFAPGGIQVAKLVPTYSNQSDGPEPFGCAPSTDGTLFTTDVGDQGFVTPTGQLIQWFPPFEGYPGAPAPFPNDAVSTNFCKIATDLGTASGVAIDGQGRVYVATPSQLSIQRFLPPFPTAPNAGGGCGATDAQGSPLADVVTREVFVAPMGLSTFTGLAIAPNGNLYASSVVTGEIFEFDLDGNLVRMILDPATPLPPHATGTPQGIAVDASDGTLYYADLDLVGVFPNLGPGPDGKVWRIRFDALGDPLPPQQVRSGLRFPDGVAVLAGDLEPLEWRSYAGGNSRRFFNPSETQIHAGNVDQLQVKWAFPTGAVITASPSVARVTVAGEGRIPVAFIQSWDGNVYAVRVADGSELWRFTTRPQDVSFPNTASVHVESIGGAERVFIGSGEFMYALDAATGVELWQFAAGTGCQSPGDCDFDAERNEIESSALVADGKVFFGMDVNDRTGGKGGLYALDAVDGRLAWFFDLESGATCRPLPGDDIRRYDGYHGEAELGLPAGFLASRPGCDHPRSPNGCGNVWSSPAADLGRGALYVASSNCDVGGPGQPPGPAMPPYDEAIFALDFDGNPLWRWRPRELDNDDLAFGAAPNLFQVEIGGAVRDVLGVGNKDGSYYLLDRDGENAVTGVRWDDPDPSGLPYWVRNVVPGGAIGGVVATAAVDEGAGRIYFGTAPGFDPLAPQRPTVHALDARTGDILWQNTAEVGADATFAPTSAVPGVVFTGSVVGGFLRAYDAATGARLASIPNGVALAAAPAILDGLLMVGGGIGTRTGNPGDFSEISSRIPHALTAYCVPGTPACTDDSLVSGRLLRLSDRDGAPERRRLLVNSKDASLAVPARGGPADPTVVGAGLRFGNPFSGEEQTLLLPASRWRGLGRPAGASGYRYSDTRAGSGPCRSALLRDGLLRVSCRGSQIGFSLDEAQQGAMAASFELGSEVAYCMSFDDPAHDRGNDGRRSGLFLARDAPPPTSCPLH